jgi:hypothetical protein
MQLFYGAQEGPYMAKSAYVSDVEVVLASLKATIATDPQVEVEFGKKLATVVELLTPKDGVTKDLKQAFTHGENWWAKNVLNGNLDGCTTDNKLEKIKKHILMSSSYHRHVADDKTKVKVERWMNETFPVQAEQMDEAA